MLSVTDVVKDADGSITEIKTKAEALTAENKPKVGLHPMPCAVRPDVSCGMLRSPLRVCVSDVSVASGIHPLGVDVVARCGAAPRPGPRLPPAVRRNSNACDHV